MQHHLLETHRYPAAHHSRQERARRCADLYSPARYVLGRYRRRRDSVRVSAPYGSRLDRLRRIDSRNCRTSRSAAPQLPQRRTDSRHRSPASAILTVQQPCWYWKLHLPFRQSASHKDQGYQSHVTALHRVAAGPQANLRN